ncbi:Siderophore-interacting protein [Frankia canadensis]|uniref:Siderophore-interacting protein n=1 Tax=Frankia canadensis TaxID=1836972 RepID=A0A2I2KZR6_9ACTN|nr:siderophore-interacting protein [Frankia canadensis]SNQ51164.1 Siderophore-interacting protein [Frankia canadensis]SOU58454.1 Siderophore-interacting protein [Frankia canadensis]
MTADSPATPSSHPSATRRRLLDRVLLRVQVAAVEPLAARTRRIVLAGAPLIDLPWTPGQSVSVLFVDPSAPGSWLRNPRDMKRSYSVWDADPTAGRLELAVYDHGGDSPGATWSRTVQPGDDVITTKPDGHLTARPDAAHHLFVGDDTAAVPLSAILRALPAGTEARAIFECDDPADELPPPGARDATATFRTTWVHRKGASAASSPLLPRAVAELDLPEQPGVAYVAGEARTVQSVRNHLVNDRGWPRRAVLTEPFWTPGKRGMD